MGNTIPHGDRLHECSPTCPQAPRVFTKRRECCDSTIAQHHLKDCPTWKLNATKQRPGDQVIPDGDLNLVDDQALLIQDIEARRQVGIERYGQGHRPFNGRDTLQDLYEEQLDLLVYLRSIKRMADATHEELVEVISKVLRENGFQQIVGDAMADLIIKRIQGWIAANIIKEVPRG